MAAIVAAIVATVSVARVVAGRVFVMGAVPRMQVNRPERRMLTSRQAEGQGEEEKELQPWEIGYKLPPRPYYGDDFSDTAIQAFYDETMSGSGGPPPPGPVRDIITAYFTFDAHLKRKNAAVKDEDHLKAYETLKEQMKLQTWITFGGTHLDQPSDGKGWVWLAAEMTVVGLCLQIYKSIPYGRRPLLVAKDDDVPSMFEKVNWDKVEERINRMELGTQLGMQEPKEAGGAKEAWGKY